METFTVVHLDGHNLPREMTFESIDEVVEFIQKYDSSTKEKIQADLEDAEFFVSDESEDEFHLYRD